MKIHKACIARLFERNDLVLDAETIAEVARTEIVVGRAEVSSARSGKSSLSSAMSMRVIGIDPGTVSIDLCGLDDGRVFLDRSLPTAEALADPALLAGLLERRRRRSISSPGRPATACRSSRRAISRTTISGSRTSRRTGKPGGIGGLRALMRRARALLAAGRAHARRRASAVGAARTAR